MENLQKDSSGKLLEFARENRQKQTKVEQLLWARLRNRKLNGFKFRRQHPLRNFILDFYCHQFLLAVEIDGDYHNQEEQKDYDVGRTFEIEELGIKVLRFTNKEVEEDIDKVLQEIAIHLK